MKIPEKKFNKNIIIEDISDIIKLMGAPYEYIGDLLEEDRTQPLGKTDSHFPRPLSYGLWFRGEQDIERPLLPSAFERFLNGNSYDEKNAFNDLRLRLPTLDLRGHSSFELLSMMRHYSLPARVLDWTENPLIALYFAVNKPPDEPDGVGTDTDSFLTCLNAYRLNDLGGHVDTNPGMFNPRSPDVLLRAFMAEHTRMEDVISRLDAYCRSIPTIMNYKTERFLREIREFYDMLPTGNFSALPKKNKDQKDEWNTRKTNFINHYRRPVAVMPKRDLPRMAAQLSAFTIHGGKLYANSTDTSSRGLKEIEPPVTLDTLNNEVTGNEKFLTHIRIKRGAKPRIKEELGRLSINGATLFPEFDHQAYFVQNRWSKLKGEEKDLEEFYYSGNNTNR